jgi:uncharacterized repeat protein (TIGR03803 family)
MNTEKLTLTRRSDWKHLWAAFLFCAVAAIASSAQTFTTLLDFNGTNGNGPSALTQGFDGNLYGTTEGGGTNMAGTVFKVTPAGTLTTLHSFCSQLRHGLCVDGQVPGAELVQATNGEFYGPTNSGGPTSSGLIFRISAAGKATTLYNFCSQPACADGVIPRGMVQATNGNLYGTAFAGGANAQGTVFEITPTGTLTTLYSFGGADCNAPYGTLIQAADGNLYGTTLGGGSPSTNCPSGCGTVFKFTLSGTLTTLHSFDLTDGAGPSGLVQGSDGNFYGTTDGGGTGRYLPCGDSCGTVFKITAAGTFTTLYNFCSKVNCPDGGVTGAALIQGTDGDFYGTIHDGGNRNGSGTIFKITPQGALTTVHDFCISRTALTAPHPEQH